MGWVVPMYQHCGSSDTCQCIGTALEMMLGEGGNAHREELLQHPAVVFLQCNLISLQGVHSDEVGMLLIPLAVRDALQQHQNEFQTPGRRAEMFGSGKWVLYPSSQCLQASQKPTVLAVHPSRRAGACPCVSIQGREREGLDGAPRAGHGAQGRMEPPGEARAELDRVRCSPIDPAGTAGP